MHKIFQVALGTVCLSALNACGSNAAPDPVDQIIVREPGQAENASNAAREIQQGDGTGQDLIAAGKSAFAACVACHAAEKGAASTVGPNLFGIAGSNAASTAGFNYSDALKSSGITWSDNELDNFLANPTGKVPGTTMVAGAVGDVENRKAIIAYLGSLTD